MAPSSSNRFLERPFTLAGAALAAAILAAFALHDTEVLQWKAASRFTGRLSMAWFCALFAVGPLHRLRPGDFTRAAMRARRRLGLAFGAIHSVHLAILLHYLQLSGHPLDPARAAGGVVAYLLLFAMMATSNDASRRRLGPKGWRGLHLLGMTYLWVSFALAYVPKLQGKQPDAGGTPLEWGLCLALVLAVGLLRVASVVTTRRRAAA